MAINAVKNRYSDNGKIISDRAFYAVVAGTLLLDFAINAILVTFCFRFIVYIAASHYFLFCSIALISIITGLIINVVSRKPVVSFIGYLLVVVPMGSLLACTLPSVSFPILRSTIVATVCISVAMLLLAFLCPNIFYSMFKVVGVCLFIAIIYQLLAVFTGFGLGDLWDWLVVCLFCCYIGFDVSLARNRPKTLDNAIDSACGLYLDIINIFVRLLAIFSRHSK